MRLDKHPVCDAFLPNAVRIHPWGPCRLLAV